MAVSFVYLPLFLMVSCHAQQKNNPSKSGYFEDLSRYRPTIVAAKPVSKNVTPINQDIRETPTKYNINKKVDTILDSIDRFNLTRKFIDGYTIQIYSGQKRDEALNASALITVERKDLAPNVQYQQPTFKVTVGKYFSRLEAQKDLIYLKTLFNNPILVPDRIVLK